MAKKQLSDDQNLSPQESDNAYFQVEIERPLYNSTTGEKLSKPHVQQYSPADFAHAIQFDVDGTPLIATLGNKINKIISIPSDRHTANVRVRVQVKDDTTRYISLKDGLEKLNQFLNQKG